MAMAKNNNTPTNKSTIAATLAPIQTNFHLETDIATFESQVDCSRTVDLFEGGQIVSY